MPSRLSVENLLEEGALLLVDVEADAVHSDVTHHRANIDSVWRLLSEQPFQLSAYRVVRAMFAADCSRLRMNAPADRVVVATVYAQLPIILGANGRLVAFMVFLPNCDVFESRPESGQSLPRLWRDIARIEHGVFCPTNLDVEGQANAIHDAFFVCLIAIEVKLAIGRGFFDLPIVDVGVVAHKDRRWRFERFEPIFVIFRLGRRAFGI